MKKLFTLGLLSLATLAWATASASAWWPCFPLKGCCSSKCCSTICCRQYNAFTPFCTGSLCCDGCCPINCAPGGCCPTQSCCMGGGDACCLGQLPAPGALAMPAMAAPAAAAPNFQAPLPNPGPSAQASPMPYNPYAGYNPYAMGVQPAGYQPSMYPGYAPMMPSAPFQAPYYWNAGR